MNAWLRQHWLALGHALGRIRQAWGSFTFNVVVISAVLLLPFSGLTLLENLLPVTRQLAADPEITVFLNTGLPRAKAQATGNELRRTALASDPAARIEFIPREQALTSLKSRTALGEAIAVLGENPLPDAFVIHLSGASGADRLATSLRGLPGVDQVQLDSEWVQRLAALTRLLRLGLLVLAVALAVVVVAVVFNTVRLQVLTQRDEIDVSRLCGATDAYVSRPFYYAGGLLGLISGAVALALLAALLPTLDSNVAELASLYGSGFRLMPLGPGPSAALLAVSLLLGCLGAGLSVRSQLRR